MFVASRPSYLTYGLWPYDPQSWADAFRSSPSLAGVVCVYDDLRRRGLEFPMTDLDALSPIHTPNRVRGNNAPKEEHLQVSYLAIAPPFILRSSRRVSQKTGLPMQIPSLLPHQSPDPKSLPVLPLRGRHLWSCPVRDQPHSLQNRYTSLKTASVTDHTEQ